MLKKTGNGQKKTQRKRQEIAGTGWKWLEIAGNGNDSFTVSCANACNEGVWHRLLCLAPFKPVKLPHWYPRGNLIGVQSRNKTTSKLLELAYPPSPIGQFQKERCSYHRMTFLRK